MALLAAHNFDEASGDILDVTSNGHSFALAAGLSRVTGHTNTGLTTSSGIIAGPATFGQTALRTVMFWLKTEADFTGWIYEWHNTAGDTGRWGLLCLSGSMGFRATTGAGNGFASITRPADNVFHHWAGTYDGSNVRLYVDSVLRATTPLAGTIVTTVDLIRMFTTVSGTQTVDDVRVYDEVLNQATIATLMDIPVVGAVAAKPVVVGQAINRAATY